MTRTHRLALLVALAAAATVAPLEAQRRRPISPTQQATGWQPVEVGIRFGYDGNTNGTVLGGQIRIPVVPRGRVELLPGADITFLRGSNDYQYNLEGAISPRGREGGLYIGGGLGRRSLVVGGAPRSTRPTRSIVLGLRGGRVAGLLVTQIELRWVFVSDLAIDPQLFSLGLNLPLWGWNRSPGGR